MKKNVLLILFFYFIINSIFSQNNKNSWPLKDKPTGRGILYKPQDYIENELNFANLFITANKGDAVIAPRSGIIKSVSYTYYNSLIYMGFYHFIYNDSLSVKKFDIAYRKAVTKDNKKDPKYISVLIRLQTKKGEIYNISGLRPIHYFKTGTKIKKGQIIGYVGHSYKKIQEPSIMVSRSINGKVADPMNVFGLKSTFISGKTKKINYATYKHPINHLKKDFTIFRESLEEGHPGIYDYTSKITLDKLLNQLYKSYTKPLTSEEFRISLLPVLKAIKDSHTALYSKKYKLTDASKLPLFFGLQNDSLLVYATTPDYANLRQKKIIKINDENVENILSKIKKIIYGNDGYVTSHDKRILMLYFGYFYKKLYQIKKNDTVKIQFSDASSRIFKYAFYKAETYSPKLKPLPKKRFSLKKLDSIIGIVDLNTFKLLETDLDSIGTFIANPNLEHLIIDVRDNSGGDIDAIKRMFSFIAKKPFKINTYEMVNKNNGYTFFKNTLNYSPKTKLFENYKELENKKGYYLLNDKNSITLPNKEQHFNKKVYILINEYSKSASTIFPALVYKHKRGKIIGRETGSSYYQLNATKFAQVYLKNTGLELYMPLVKSVFDAKENSDIPWGRGVLPDKEVKISFTDFFGENDPILEATLNSISNNKKENTTTVYKNKTYLLIGGSFTFIALLMVVFYVRKKKK